MNAQLTIQQQATRLTPPPLRAQQDRQPKTPATLHQWPQGNTSTPTDSATTEADSGITELVLTKHSPDDIMLLLPMLAHLSQISDRWITWIVSSKIDRQLLSSFGVVTGKIRLIYCPPDEDNRWMLWEALNNGTSHTVIASPNDTDDATMQHMEAAARQGNCRGLFVRYR